MTTPRALPRADSGPSVLPVGRAAPTPLAGELSPSVLKSLLIYSASSGDFFWSARDQSFFKSVGSCKAWNKRFANKKAFSDTGDGYLGGTILGRKVKAHRVAWAMHYGAWPMGEIDHVDGNRSNNAIANLRDVSRSENCKNRGTSQKNTSGSVGVTWDARDRLWKAQLQVNGKCVHIGCFKNKDEAIVARKIAQRKFGFHKNHGQRPAHSLRVKAQ